MRKSIVGICVLALCVGAFAQELSEKELKEKTALKEQIVLDSAALANAQKELAAAKRRLVLANDMIERKPARRGDESEKAKAVREAQDAVEEYTKIIKRKTEALSAAKLIYQTRYPKPKELPSEPPKEIKQK